MIDRSSRRWNKKNRKKKSYPTHARGRFRGGGRGFSGGLNGLPWEGTLIFKTNTARKDFARIDQRLQFILFALSQRFGIIVTNLFDGDPGRSLHPLGKAADVVPDTEYQVNQQLTLIKQFLDRHVAGLDVVIVPHGTAPHAHIELDPKGTDQITLRY